MRKISVLLSTLLLLASCSDGDLQIETIDFDDVAIEFCAPLDEDTRVLFKRNMNEALIVNLQSGILSNGSLEMDSVISTSSISNQTQLIYRVFSDNVPANYFCDAFPPVTPTVIEEVTADNGILTIITKVNADNTAFIHEITLNEISFENALGERLTDLNIRDFGTITTPITEEN